MSEIESLLVQLNDDDEEERRWAAEDLGAMQDPRIGPALVRHLGDACVAVAEACADALATIGGRETVAALLPLLHSEGAQERNAAVDVLQQISADGLDLLVEQMRDPDRDVRKFAIDALGVVHAPGIRAALAAALADPDVNVAAAAAECLGNLGDESAIPALAASLASGPAWLQCSAATSLGRLGGVDARAALLHAAANADGLVRFAAVQSLGELQDPAVLPVLTELLAEDDAGLKVAIVQALIAIVAAQEETGADPNEIGPASTVDVAARPQNFSGLTELLTDGNPAVRGDAARLLGYWRVQEAVTPLLALFRADDEETRTAAVQAILHIRPTDVQPLIALLTDLDDADRQIPVLEVLGRLGNVNAVPTLLAVLASGTSALRRAAAQALEGVADAACVSTLLPFLNDRDGHVQASIARIMERLHVQAAIDPLLALACHTYPDVREAAVSALVAIDTGAALQGAHRLLAADAATERLSAVQILGQMPDADLSWLPRVRQDPDAEVRRSLLTFLSLWPQATQEEILSAAVSDTMESVRLEAVKAVWRLRLPRACQVLQRVLMQDSSTQVRYEAAKVLGEIADRRCVPALVQALAGDSEMVQVAAAEALGNVGDIQAVEPLQRYLDSDNWDLREAVEDALEQLELA